MQVRAARHAEPVEEADALEGLEESVETGPLPLLDEAGGLLLLLLSLLQVRREVSRLLHLLHLTHHLWGEDLGWK